MSENEKPATLESKKIEMQESLNKLGNDPDAEQLKRQVIYMAKSFEHVTAIYESEKRAIIGALVSAQRLEQKIYRRLHESKWGRFKLFIKKILIGLNWYEASQEELQLIHEQNHGAIE